MIDAGTMTAIATTAGVVGLGTWRVFTVLNAKANKSTTDEIFKMVNADRADIATLNTNVAVMATDFKHLADTLQRVDRNTEELLRNGRSKKDHA